MVKDEPCYFCNEPLGEVASIVVINEKLQIICEGCHEIMLPDVPINRDNASPKR